MSYVALQWKISHSHYFTGATHTTSCPVSTQSTESVFVHVLFSVHHSKLTLVLLVVILKGNCVFLIFFSLKLLLGQNFGGAGSVTWDKEHTLFVAFPKKTKNTSSPNAATLRKKQWAALGHLTTVSTSFCQTSLSSLTWWIHALRQVC